MGLFSRWFFLIFPMENPPWLGNRWSEYVFIFWAPRISKSKAIRTLVCQTSRRRSCQSGKKNGGGTWVSLFGREFLSVWDDGVMVGRCFLKRATCQSMVRLKIAWWVLVVWFLLTFHPLYIWLLVWNHFSHFYWECHHPNWRTHIFQRGRSTTNQIGYS